MNLVPENRIVKINDAPINPKGSYILYWMTAFRRIRWNYSLDRAIFWARDLDKPLVIFEALRCGYGWASDRFHKFIIEGMMVNEKILKKNNVFYYPYVESSPDEDKGLLNTLSKKACVIVTDDYPAFFLPRMIASVSKKTPVLMEKVDSNGILPIRYPQQLFTTAYSFRRFLQKRLPSFLLEHPEPEPLKKTTIKKLKSLPKKILERWPPGTVDLLGGRIKKIRSLHIDHNVPFTRDTGGHVSAGLVLKKFLDKKINSYIETRNHPEIEGTSGLSSFLHFGHISAHEIFHNIIKKEDWYIGRISPLSTGSRSGWWGVGESSEAFLDQLITWRELGFNMCCMRNDYDRYESLPDWAKISLEAHETDERDYLYSLEEFEMSQTHDKLWNAAQQQLVRDGMIHNYLRMLWGKKILEWSPSPREAIKIMIELNNKYALDGRDPNSYSGIFWVLGRYDRAWGPERQIFGKIRYMSSENTARKTRVKDYIKKYS